MNQTNSYFVIQELLQLKYKPNVDDFRRIYPNVVRKNYSGYINGKFVDINVIFNFQKDGEVTIYTYDNRHQIYIPKFGEISKLLELNKVFLLLEQYKFKIIYGD